MASLRAIERGQNEWKIKGIPKKIGVVGVPRLIHLSGDDSGTCGCLTERGGGNDLNEAWRVCL